MIETIKNLDKNLLTILIPVIILVLGIIGFFIKRRFTQRDTRISRELEKAETDEKEFAEARKEFIAVFDDALIRLKSKRQGASGILKETMPPHEVAFKNFKRILEKIKGSTAVARFEKTWNHYYNDHPHHHFATYNASGFEGADNREKEQAANNEAIKRINKVIDSI